MDNNNDDYIFWIVFIFLGIATFIFSKVLSYIDNSYLKGTIVVVTFIIIIGLNWYINLKEK